GDPQHRPHVVVLLGPGHSRICRGHMESAGARGVRPLLPNRDPSRSGNRSRKLGGAFAPNQIPQVRTCGIWYKTHSHGAPYSHGAPWERTRRRAYAKDSFSATCRAKRENEIEMAQIVNAVASLERVDKLGP